MFSLIEFEDSVDTVTFKCQLPMEKHKVVQPYDEILLSGKEERSAGSCYVCEAGRRDAQ